MAIQVLIERVGSNGFRATSGAPLAGSVEAATREEALRGLREELINRLRQGAEIMSLEVEAQGNPWITFAGMFKDNPMFEDVLEIIAQNRKKDNEATDSP